MKICDLDEIQLDDIVLGENLNSIDEWSHILIKDDLHILIPYQCFPSEKIRNIYLSEIHTRSEHEIKCILRLFLIGNASFRSDDYIEEALISNPNKERLLFENEFIHRLITKKQPWEGITWVMDLLDSSPKDALLILDSYLTVHNQFLPDFVCEGLFDAMAIIRARYINYPHSNDIFFDLKSEDFEYLIAALFDKLGYKTELTKKGGDGGIDIICRKNENANKEYLLIQCKSGEKKTDVTLIRELYGVVMDRKATKGILCTASLFTSPAIKFADANPSLELLNYKDIIQLLNETFGKNWPNRIDSIIYNKKNNFN